MDDWAKVGLSGPLAEHAAGFAVWLSARGYRPSTVVFHVRLMAYVSRWVQALGLAVSALDAALVDAVLAERRAAGYAAGLGRGSLRPLVEYLRSVGVIPAVEVDAVASATEALLSRYGQYLATERGLAPGTIARNVDLVRPFLADRERGGRVELETLSAGEVIAYVLKFSRRQPRSVARAVTALRSLLMFLHVAGVTEGGLADAVPTVARRRLAGLPKALPGEQVAAMLASCNRGSAVGRRDAAVLTVLSRLGLRAGEVGGLRLEDVDWRRGEILITGKANRRERLPLPADVGDAIVSYLSSGRPQAVQARELFLCVRAPHRAMSRGAVTNVVATAARKAGLGVVHAHRLRHSVATAMLAAGASLAEIGQVLRHRHPLTTMIYAKVDIEALRSVARIWPSAGSAGVA